VTALAVILLVVAGLVVVASLTRGIKQYRSTMSREWPKVEPRDDDEDW
jgi:hypothetical protein